MKEPKFYRRFDYDRQLLPNAHLRELETGVATIEQARARSGLTIGYPGWGVLYYATLCALEPGRPATIVETGTNWGCSTIVLASALEAAGVDGVVHTIEINPDNHAKARDNFAKAGVGGRVVPHLGDTREVLPRLLPTLGELSVVFLDGGHTSELVRSEFEAILPKLAPRAIVMLDNTYQIAESHEDQLVNGFLKWLMREHGGNLVNLPFCSWYTPGLAIWQRAPF